MNTVKPSWWGGLAALMAVALLTPSAKAQTPLTLTTDNGSNWKLKKVDVGSTDVAPAEKAFVPDATWTDVTVPGDIAPDIGENIWFWYRLDGIKIPSDWPKTGYFLLHNFQVDDTDTTYLNGKQIGTTGAYDTNRSYVITPDQLDFTGNNSLAILGTQGTGGAGMNTTSTFGGPTLEPGPTDKGILIITSNDASGKAITGTPFSYTAPDPNDPTLTVMVDAATVNGKFMLTNLEPGTMKISITPQAWTGTITPSGDQTVAITGGKLTTLALTVSPFTYEVVRAATPIIIDGNISGPEWDGATPMVTNNKKQASVGTAWQSTDDLSGITKWKWDDTYIYLAADVTDDSRINEHVANPADWGNVWQGDGFETYIQLDPYASARSAYVNDKNFQWSIGVAADNTVGWKIFRPTPGDKLPPIIPEPTADMVKVVSKTTPKPGYILEARFPWASLPDANKTLIPPKVGTGGAIGLALNDTDEDSTNTAARDTQLNWNTFNDLWTNPSHYTRSIWGGLPGQAVCKPGDVNGDKVVTVADAVLVLKAAAKLITFDPDQTRAADVKRDGSVNVTDAVLVLKAVAKLTTLPDACPAN